MIPTNIPPDVLRAMAYKLVDAYIDGEVKGTNAIATFQAAQEMSGPVLADLKDLFLCIHDDVETAQVDPNNAVAVYRHGQR